MGNTLVIIAVIMAYAWCIMAGFKLISVSVQKNGEFNGFVFGMGLLVILQALEPFTTLLLEGVLK